MSGALMNKVWDLFGMDSADQEEYEDENDGHLKSYHSDDLSVDSIIHEEEEDAMRGVSNVVYRKE